MKNWWHLHNALKYSITDLEKQPLKFSLYNTKSALTKGDEGHDEDLSALSEEDRQKHAHPGWPKHITMNLLPARLLLGFLLQEI